MHMLEISANLQKAGTSPVALLKSVSTTGTHPPISKTLETLKENICGVVSSQYS